MKLQEIMEPMDDEEDDFPMTQLKDLSAYVYHGRFYFADKDVQNMSDEEYNEMSNELRESDIYDWAGYVDNYYELIVSAKTKLRLAIADRVVRAYIKPQRSEFAICGNDLTHANWRAHLSEIR